MRYENASYWRELHREHRGSLRAVGHPDLSESLNELKYRSESDALLRAVLDAAQLVDKQGEEPLRLLDVGGGVGYWSGLLSQEFAQRGIEILPTILDISGDALGLVETRWPEFETVQADLKTIDLHRCAGRFQVVMACYCLHHLDRLGSFLHGLQFCARSVAEGGCFVIMDPILRAPYSPLYSVEFGSEVNGVARPLQLIDDVLDSEGLERLSIEAAVSFLLNGSIEARSKLGWHLTDFLWRVLCRLCHRSDARVRTLDSLLAPADRGLKRAGLGFSSSVCVYRRCSSKE